MRKLLFATAALSFAAIAPASAQMMGDPMMSPGAQSCVMGGQFVPCPPMGGMQPGMMARPGMMNQGAGMAPGMAMEEPGMDRPMTARERRQQQRMMRQQSM
jgi:hypothetical protein